MKKILIADDDVKFCSTAKMILKKEGYEVEIANNGEEALQKFSESRHDIVLLDIIMPLTTGLEVCKQIKSDKNNGRVLVIMMSGNVTEIECSFDYGADDCFLKPVNWDLLIKKIQSLN